MLRRTDVETLFARLSAADLETRRKLLVQPERAELIVEAAPCW